MSADHSSHAPHAGPFPNDSGARPGVAPAFPSDEQVLRDMAAGHEGALLELHRRYARALYGLGGRILASPEAVQQGVEDAMMTAWHHAAHYEPARASVHGWLISIAHHRFLHLRRGAGGTLRLHDQFGRLDTPGDQDLHLLALAYYCGEPPERLSELSGLPRPAVEEALLSAITRLPGLAQEALAKATAPAPAAPEEPAAEAAAEAAETDLFPTLSSLAATAPVTRVEPWEPPRRPQQRGAGAEAEPALSETPEAAAPVPEPEPAVTQQTVTLPAEESAETTAPGGQA